MSLKSFWPYVWSFNYSELIVLGSVTGILFILFFCIQFFSVSRLRVMASRTTSDVDDFFVELFAKTRKYFLLALAFFIASFFTDISLSSLKVFRGLLSIFIFLQIWTWGASLLDFLARKLIGKDRDLQNSEEAIQGTIPVLQFLGRLILFSVLLLLALDNFGVNITALVAGLGVGGIAVALAVQNILGDLFSSLSIVLDKPFKVGDAIDVGGMSGTVEKIGLKSTRVRSDSGEELVFSNSDLLGSRIRNFKKMRRRRMLLNFSLKYDTAPAKVQQAVQIVKEDIQSNKKCELDRVNLRKFGNYSLEFEASYYVLNPDFKFSLDVHESIMMRIIEEFSKAKIEFAYQPIAITDEAQKKMNWDDVTKLIVNVPDFPKPGIQFKDITPILQNGRAFQLVLDRLCEGLHGQVDVIAGIESRGFLLGSAMADRLRSGFVPIRKSGKLPRATHAESYGLEYGNDRLEIHQDALTQNQRVLIVDDVLATGGTALAAYKLCKQLHAKIVGFHVLIELKFLNGRQKLDIPVRTLLEY